MLALTREKLLSHLRDIPMLVNMYQHGDPLFAQKTVRWLEQVEETLVQLRSPLVSLVAAGRGKILATSDGYAGPGTSVERTPKRKVRNVTITMTLIEIETALRNKVEDIDAKFGAWREKMVQFIAVATTKDAIPLPPTEPHEAWLKTVWRSFHVSSEMKGMYNYLNTVMAQSDRLYILNELIENVLSRN